MDNLTKHLLEKMKTNNSFNTEGNSTIIRLEIPKCDDTIKQIDILSEFYKTSKEIVTHLQKKSNIVVSHSIEEIIIIY